MDRFLSIVAQILSPHQILCFEANNFVLELLLLCREIDGLVVLEVVKKFASPKLNETWNLTIRKLDQLSSSFFMGLNEQNYGMTLNLELEKKYNNDEEIFLLMESMKMKF